MDISVECFVGQGENTKYNHFGLTKEPLLKPHWWIHSFREKLPSPHYPTSPQIIKAVLIKIRLLSKVPKLPHPKNFPNLPFKNQNIMDSGFIPKHGGYKSLLTFKKAEIIYDGTVYFCSKNFRRNDRTIDQMVQAARSGKQNIVEASIASGTSKKSEIFLSSNPCHPTQISVKVLNQMTGKNCFHQSRAI